MVGNSPRSDINPALQAGLRDILIPHPRTWELEHDEVHQEGRERFRELKRFEDLLELLEKW
jgi:putative hydrolase of the HAD superfamily